MIASDTLDAAELAVRFFHLDKLPVVQRAGVPAEHFDQVAAGISGVPVAAYRDIAASFEQIRAESVRMLARRPAVQEALSRLPFDEGATIVALGDSITDDLLSWAHLLDGLLRTERASLNLVIMNAGFTGNTTQEAISRFDTIARHSPDWIIQMLGTNDARRHGSHGVRTTSPGESRRNLRVLEELVASETSAQHVVLTPPPVVGEWADSWQPFALERISWTSDDIAALAQDVRDADPDFLIDIHGLLAPIPPTEWLLPDGVHPNSYGQRLIAEAILVALAGEAATR